MARKRSADSGNDNYTLLIDLILNLTPKQVKLLYTELRDRYTNRGHTKIYNVLGEIDKEHGRIRLTEFQYKNLRVKYGDTYMNRALQVLDDYIQYLEQHQDESKYRNKLIELKGRTHNKELSYGGWVYKKCQGYICKQPEENVVQPVNPFLIEDITVAKKYIEGLSPAMRRMPDVQLLLTKFPTLKDLFE